MHSLTISRGLSVIAGGRHNSWADSHGARILEVKAQAEDSEWDILESSLMGANASRRDYTQKLTVKGHELSYYEAMTLDIYGRTFLYTDVRRYRRSSGCNSCS